MAKEVASCEGESALGSRECFIVSTIFRVLPIAKVALYIPADFLWIPSSSNILRVSSRVISWKMSYTA
jgi:hypothetical protein